MGGLGGGDGGYGRRAAGGLQTYFTESSVPQPRYLCLSSGWSCVFFVVIVPSFPKFYNVLNIVQYILMVKICFPTLIL